MDGLGRLITITMKRRRCRAWACRQVSPDVQVELRLLRLPPSFPAVPHHFNLPQVGPCPSQNRRIAELQARHHRIFRSRLTLCATFSKSKAARDPSPGRRRYCRCLRKNLPGCERRSRRRRTHRAASLTERTLEVRAAARMVSPAYSLDHCLQAASTREIGMPLDNVIVFHRGIGRFLIARWETARAALRFHPTLVRVEKSLD